MQKNTWQVARKTLRPSSWPPVGLDSGHLYDFLHTFQSPSIFIVMNIQHLWINCPEIKFIGWIDLQSVSNKNKKKYQNENIFLPTDPNFFTDVTGNTHIIFLGLRARLNYQCGCWNPIQLLKKSRSKSEIATIDHQMALWRCHCYKTTLSKVGTEMAGNEIQHRRIQIRQKYGIGEHGNVKE